MTALRFGYCTNSMTDHRLPEALRFLADTGYRGVAITVDVHHLDPDADDLYRRTRTVADLLRELDLAVVVETGARYVLDPRRKHGPTLLDDDAAARGRRLAYLRTAAAVAADLGAPTVHMFSGVLPAGVGAEVGWRRLLAGTGKLLIEAERRGVRWALEPEPGMLVATLDDADRLFAALDGHPRLGLTLDLGHCRAIEAEGEADCVRRAAPRLAHVQVDDARRGVHEHLPLGTGELDLAGALAALVEVGYDGLVCVELPRHGHAAAELVPASLAALRTASPPAGPAVVPGVTGPQAWPAVAPGVPEQGREWLAAAAAAVRADPRAVHTRFPAVGRQVGRAPVQPGDPAGLVHGTVDDAARAVLLDALRAATTRAELGRQVGDLYRHGDADERRGVLRALAGLAADLDRETVTDLLGDALRSNDTRLVAAALGPAGRALDDHTWRHGVLKCLFLGIPLVAVADLSDRADAELRRMVADFAAERRAAGRDVPGDAEPLLIKEAL